MDKRIIMLATSLFLAVTALASSTGKTMEEWRDVVIRKQDQPGNRPRTTELSVFRVGVDTENHSLSVIAAYDVDEVSAVIENLTTGELYEYSFDSSDVAVLPISGSEGLWYITLSLIDGTDYIGEFEL